MGTKRHKIRRNADDARGKKGLRRDPILAKGILRKRIRSTMKSPTSRAKPKYISVAIRIRPRSAAEKERNEDDIWKCDIAEGIIHEREESFRLDALGNDSHIPSTPGVICRNHFDYICPEDGETQEVYNNSCKPVVLGCCKGINGTIFAYGQTSSGKTYTMLGTETKPGVLILALSDVFHCIRTCPEREFALRVSYLEIHNEVVNDLLEPDKENLQVVSTNDGLGQGPHIPGLTEVPIKTPHDLIRVLLKGEEHRKVAQTTSNERSSRSHTIFQLHIQSKLKNLNTNEEEKENSEKVKGSTKILASTFACVDLAGSESVSQVASKQQQKECRYINRSLLGLGRVIMTLSQLGESPKGNRHIPYRDSKLTRILQPALGGNATCTVICTISPTRTCREETLHTLHFARTAKQCKNHIAVNERLDDKELLKKYQNLIKLLKKKIKVYIAKAQQAQQTQKAMSKLRKINKDMACEIKDLRTQLSMAHSRTNSPLPYQPGSNSTCGTPEAASSVPASKTFQKEEKPENNEQKHAARSSSSNSLHTLPATSDQWSDMADTNSVKSNPNSLASSASYVNQAISALQSKLQIVEQNMQTLAFRVDQATTVDPDSIAGNITAPIQNEGKSLIYTAPGSARSMFQSPPPQNFPIGFAGQNSASQQLQQNNFSPLQAYKPNRQHVNGPLLPVLTSPLQYFENGTPNANYRAIPVVNTSLDGEPPIVNIDMDKERKEDTNAAPQGTPHIPVNLDDPVDVVISSAQAAAGITPVKDDQLDVPETLIPTPTPIPSPKHARPAVPGAWTDLPSNPLPGQQHISKLTGMSPEKIKNLQNDIHRPRMPPRAPVPSTPIKPAIRTRSGTFQELKQLVAIQENEKRILKEKLEDLKHGKTDSTGKVSAFLKKLCSRGRTKFRLVTIDPSNNTLGYEKKQYTLSDIKEIKKGIFQERKIPFDTNLNEDKCFTIFFTSESMVKNITFVTASKLQRESWVASLTQLTASAIEKESKKTKSNEDGPTLERNEDGKEKE